MRSRALNNSTDKDQQQNEILTLPSLSYSSLSQSRVRDLIFQRNVLMVIMCTILSSMFILYHWWSPLIVYPSKLSSTLGNQEATTNACEISLGEYQGPIYNSVESGTIGKPKCLLDSKWIQVSIHTVKFPGSDTIYDDWMWIDYHDRINVLVEDETKTREIGKKAEERRFLIFEQTKYALEGRKSLAIIGGIIEPGEDAEMAARREVGEEMNGLVCENFHFLGRYRSDVNRGMGWLSGFLATQCTRNQLILNKDHLLAEEIGAADTEKQNLISLTLTELKNALARGKFLEVQWTATVAQALHHPELHTI